MSGSAARAGPAVAPIAGQLGRQAAPLGGAGGRCAPAGRRSSAQVSTRRGNAPVARLCVDHLLLPPCCQERADPVHWRAHSQTAAERHQRQPATVAHRSPSSLRSVAKIPSMSSVICGMPNVMSPSACRASRCAAQCARRRMRAELTSPLLSGKRPGMVSGNSRCPRSAAGLLCVRQQAVASVRAVAAAARPARGAHPLAVDVQLRRVQGRHLGSPGFCPPGSAAIFPDKTTVFDTPTGHLA